MPWRATPRPRPTPAVRALAWRICTVPNEANMAANDASTGTTSSASLDDEHELDSSSHHPSMSLSPSSPASTGMFTAPASNADPATSLIAPFAAGASASRLSTRIGSQRLLRWPLVILIWTVIIFEFSTYPIRASLPSV